MPVVLVNPRRGRRRRRRRNPSRRSNPRRYRRRRNPTSATFGGAMVTLMLAGFGGALGYGVDWGVSHMKTAAGWQLATLMGVGILGTLGLAKWGDERMAAGLGGTTIALGIGRTREIIALSKLGADKEAPKQLPGESAAVYRQPYYSGHEAGAVVRMNPTLQSGARTLRMPVFGRTFKEAGAVVRMNNPSAYVPGPVRYFGPRSWIYNTEAGRVVRVRSAHSSG